MKLPFDFGSLPMAIGEIMLLLSGASVLGWLLARMIIRTRIHNLQQLIEERKFKLAEYRTLTNDSVDYPIATNASKTVYPKISPDHEPDDLKIIEGIGPKIEEILNKEGIHTFEQLTETSVIRIASILKKAGPRFQLHDPSSWPDQASLAREKRWEELDKLKTRLISGNA
jgi:predicted flap endonuclease-1-like 5' DNA nuclease